MQDLILKYRKFDFGWGSAPDTAGKLTALSIGPLAGFKGPSYKGKGRKKKGKRGELPILVS